MISADLSNSSNSVYNSASFTEGSRIHSPQTYLQRVNTGVLVSWVKVVARESETVYRNSNDAEFWETPSEHHVILLTAPYPFRLNRPETTWTVRRWKQVEQV